MGDVCASFLTPKDVNVVVSRLKPSEIVYTAQPGPGTCEPDIASRRPNDRPGDSTRNGLVSIDVVGARHSFEDKPIMPDKPTKVVKRNIGEVVLPNPAHQITGLEPYALRSAATGWFETMADERTVRLEGLLGSWQAATNAWSTESAIPQARAFARTCATVPETVASAPGQASARSTRRCRVV